MSNTILIIEDTESIRKDVSEIIKNLPNIKRILEAGNGIDGFRMLLENQVDLILCDLVMPGMDGFKFLSLKESRSDLSDIPVIILTSQTETKDKIKGLEHGASDYVTKPFDEGELTARVRVQLKIKNLQDELRASNARLAEISVTDPLTRVFNRRYLFEILEKEFDRALRYKSSLSFVMVDIDFFKRVNDRFGHQVGDQVLVDVANLVREELRKPDVLGRYGGEEFGVILPETDLKGAWVVAERYRTRVAEYRFGTAHSPIRTTISLGVAAVPDSKVRTVDELVKEADDSLYQAKNLGRNRTQLGSGSEAPPSFPSP